MVKCLPARWETRVQSLGREDPLEKEMATHSSTLAWKIPWTEEPGMLQSMGSQRVGHDRATSLTHIRLETIKLLEENIGRTFFDTNHNKFFFGFFSQGKGNKSKTKLNKWNLIKFKSFCTEKEIMNKTKRQPTEMGEIIYKLYDQ